MMIKKQLAAGFLCREGTPLVLPLGLHGSLQLIALDRSFIENGPFALLAALDQREREFVAINLPVLDVSGPTLAAGRQFHCARQRAAIALQVERTLNDALTERHF